jgi:hypothetical protein
MGFNSEVKVLMFLIVMVVFASSLPPRVIRHVSLVVTELAI